MSQFVAKKLKRFVLSIETVGYKNINSFEKMGLKRKPTNRLQFEIYTVNVF